MKLLGFFVKNYFVFNFYLYDLTEFNVFEQVFFESNKCFDVVFLCIGTKNYFNDSFGVRIGDELKKCKVYCYGSSTREVNGTNFMEVYRFVKSKHKSSKIIIIDSVYFKTSNSPILVYQNTGVVVSGLNNKTPIGDAGILFNSFSYHNNEKVKNILGLITKMLKNFVKI